MLFHSIISETIVFCVLKHSVVILEDVVVHDESASCLRWRCSFSLSECCSIVLVFIFISAQVVAVINWTLCKLLVNVVRISLQMYNRELEVVLGVWNLTVAALWFEVMIALDWHILLRSINCVRLLTQHIQTSFANSWINFACHWSASINLIGFTYKREEVFVLITVSSFDMSMSLHLVLHHKSHRKSLALWGSFLMKLWLALS